MTSKSGKPRRAIPYTVYKLDSELYKLVTLHAENPFWLKCYESRVVAIASLRVPRLCICTLKYCTRSCLKELLSIGRKRCNPFHPRRY